jgi:hypothetical protein
MDVLQLRKRLKKRAERARVAQGQLECLICKKNRAPLLSGAARIFDLGATFGIRSVEIDPKLAWAAKKLDSEALNSDWKRAGGLWWEALASITDELDDETMARVASECKRASRSKYDGLASSPRHRPVVTAAH